MNTTSIDKSHLYRSMKEVVGRLWSVVYPAVKQVSTSLTAPAGVGNVAADFILLRAESDTRADNVGASHSLVDMVRHWTQNRLVPVEISANVLYSVTHTSAVGSVVTREVLVASLGVCSAIATPGTTAYDLVRREIGRAHV